MDENTDDFEIHIGRSSYEVKDPVIKIAGVGTFGCTIIHDFLEQFYFMEEAHAQLIAMETDLCWLDFVKAPYKVLLGESLTGGMGAVRDPDIGRRAAIISKEDIKQAINGTDLLFILAGLGGGTGSGAAPVIAEIARDAGILTVVLVVMPLDGWGKTIHDNANKSLAALGKIANITIAIPNDTLLSISDTNPKMNMEQALKAINTVFYDLLYRTVIELIHSLKRPSIIDIDLDDLKQFCEGTGFASVGFGISPSSAAEATRIAINNPLLQKPIGESNRFIVLIKMSRRFSLKDAQTTLDIIYEFMRPEDHSQGVILGVSGNLGVPGNHWETDNFEVTIIVLEKRENTQ